MFNLFVSSTRACRFLGKTYRIAGHSVRCHGDQASSNVVVSPYEACEVPTCTVTQRFFELTSKWPHKIAMVRMPIV